MKKQRYKVTDKTNAKFIEFVNRTKAKNHLFQSFNVFDYLLRAITHCLGKRIKIKMGSKFFYKSFNKNYFFKNLYKNLVAIEYLSTIKDISNCSISYTVNDIGCGSAPSSIAYELLFNHKDKMQFNLKDTSKYQMYIAKEMLKQQGISKADIDESSVSAHDFENMAGLTFFSYFLCEQTPKELAFIRDSILHITGHVICIDYERNLKQFADFLKGHFDVCRIKLSVQLSSDIRAILNTEEITVNGLYFYAKRTG